MRFQTQMQEVCVHDVIYVASMHARAVQLLPLENLRNRRTRPSTESCQESELLLTLHFSCAMCPFRAVVLVNSAPQRGQYDFAAVPDFSRWWRRRLLNVENRRPLHPWSQHRGFGRLPTTRTCSSNPMASADAPTTLVSRFSRGSKPVDAELEAVSVLLTRSMRADAVFIVRAYGW